MNFGVQFGNVWVFLPTFVKLNTPIDLNEKLRMKSVRTYLVQGNNNINGTKTFLNGLSLNFSVLNTHNAHSIECLPQMVNKKENNLHLGAGS